MLDPTLPFIRPPTPSDEAAIAALWVQLLAYHRPGFSEVEAMGVCQFARQARVFFWSGQAGRLL